MSHLVRIRIDREIFVRQRFGGISRYFSEMLRHLGFGAAPDLDVDVAFERSSNHHLNAVLAELGRQMKPLRRVPRGVPRMLNTVDPVKDAYLTFAAGGTPDAYADIVHATYLRPRASDIASAARLTCTLQDMIAEQLGYPEHHAARRGKAELVRRADVVIATTRHTAALAQERWGAFPHVVINLGVDVETFTEPMPAPNGIDFPYVLFVGTRSGYKNFDIVPKALARIRQQLDVGLAIVGPPPSAEERVTVTQSLPSDRQFWISADEQTLVALYQHAAAFVFPSRFEGFGLPALEAAAAGTQVLLSRIPVFEELASGWASFFDPDDVDELAAALLGAIDSPDPRVDRAVLPTWAQCAAAHADVYRSLG